MTILSTERLRLEPIDDRHFDGLQAMNSQSEVMRFISGQPETPAQTRHMIELVKGRWAQYGFSWWAFIEKETERLVGAGCIQYLGRDPANPHEIGWRLVPDRWGMGLASEAAHAMAAWAFDHLAAPTLVAVRLPENTQSAKVMDRLGLRYRGVETWYERPHAVHELTRADWRAQQAS
ncbi:GNAT family N-acetyltransferase [Massilia sp. Leaf139]|uniref:GNAT family N-acetyltransferase n=1 Tax=Massilia sp. Leaf139 TaxID=1736272 RepID=UPI00070069EB|nr:GNAT family N-acetyltransferase [Massilia sp. Leaf139]KQQ97088.1 guanosine monophosphate synthetase [Massilia sp. Leaf139]